MPNFSANLTMMFNEVEFLERFSRASQAGFKAVEYMFPYDWPQDQLVDALAANGLKQVLHNLPAGNWAGGERGIACLPGREGEFQQGVGQAIEYAKALGCPTLNCLVGPHGCDVPNADQLVITGRVEPVGRRCERQRPDRRDRPARGQHQPGRTSGLRLRDSDRRQRLQANDKEHQE